MELQMRNMLVAVKNALHNIDEPFENPDYDVIFEMAGKQAILPIVFQGCYKDKKLQNYPDLALVRDAVYNTISQQTLKTAAFEEIYREFLRNGIEPIVLKGIICRNLYGELGDYRESSDEDMFIEVKDFFKAKKLLIDNGYAVKDSKIPENKLHEIQEVTFVNEEKGLLIELHLNSLGNDHSLIKKMNGYFENSFEDKIAVEINGTVYFTLEYTKNYLFLFFHLFKHFLSSGVGLRQLIDLHMFGNRYRELIDWNIVFEVIKDNSAWGFYGDVLAVANRYLGFDLPQVSEPINPELLIEDIENSGVFGKSSNSRAKSRAFVLAALGSSGKISFIKLLFPSVDQLKNNHKELYDKPWLIPVVWIKRLVKYIRSLFRRKGRKVILDAEHIAEKRIILLKKYGIME